MHSPAWRGFFYFNSRPSARGDVHRDCKRMRGVRISIHAPPRGATRESVAQRVGVNDFNSRPSARGDGAGATATYQRDVFQFTPLREGRLDIRLLRSRRCYFNSRPSARGDGKRYAISANLLFNPYKSAWLNNSATQFVEIILVIFHRIIA